MTESIIIDLMSELNVGFLENQYLEQDIKAQKQGLFHKKHAVSRPCKRGNEFVLSDSLKNTIYEQRELYDNIVAIPLNESDNELWDVKGFLDEQLESMKAKFVVVFTGVSGIAAMSMVAVGIVVVLAKKKGFVKLLGKRTHAA